MIIEVQTILRDSDLSTFEYITRRGIFGSCSISIFNFLRNLHLFSISAKIYTPINSVQGFKFLHNLSNTHAHTYI